MKRQRILPADDHLMVTAGFQKAPLLSTHGAFKSTPGVNFATLEVILINGPVRGLRPFGALRRYVEKVMNSDSGDVVALFQRVPDVWNHKVYNTGRFSLAHIDFGVLSISAL